MEGQAVVTSASEFYSKMGKVVTLKSGLTVRLRKIAMRDGLRGGGVMEMLASVKDILKGDAKETDEQKKERWDKLTKEQRTAVLDANENLIISAVMEPVITRDPESGKVCIKDLPDNDYHDLLKEITAYSLPQRGELPEVHEKPRAAEPPPAG